MSLSKTLKYLNYLIKAQSAHGVHSPFVFRFIHEIITNKNESFYQFKELGKIRQELLKNETVLNVEDYGVGSRVFKSNKRRVADITKYGTSRKKFSEMYFRLVNFSGAQYIVELGTSIGMNTLYLATANTKSRVFTVEGSKELYTFSQQLFEKNQVHNITSINDTFEAALPLVLAQIPQLDLLFVDGNHQYQPTMNYFNQALLKKTADSVFVFDDINWSEDMSKAWEEIKNHPEVTLSFDLFFVGIVFFRREQKEKEHFVLKY